MVIHRHFPDKAFRFLRTLLAVSACLISITQAVEMEAQLDRESVAAGEGALLTLEIGGEVAERPEVPAVEDLIVRPQGQSRQIQIINGRTTTTVSYTYVVGSQVPGDYMIPAIEIVIDGNKLSSQPLKQIGRAHV